MLAINGVPRTRARSVSNGIDVLTTRLGRELAASRERVRALREALRKVAVCRESGNAIYEWSCQICNWQAWSDGEPERHKPGCIAAPDSAASPTGGEG